MSTTITTTTEPIDINVVNDIVNVNVINEQVEVNIVEEIIQVSPISGAYPLPSTVYSVFGRIGAILAQVGDYNTSQVTENTNLYFTNARSRNAISLTTIGTSGAATYDSATGVFNIPQYQIGGTVTSVGLTTNSPALSISNSPITTSGNIGLNFSGSSTQYVAGDGSLVNFPTIITEAQNLICDVYNQTGATLTKGTIVYINGGHGNLPSVTKSQANNEANSSQTFGIVQVDITNMNNGHVVIIGTLDNLNTSAYSDGTILYLSPTVAGAWTDVKPSAPNHMVYVGTVVRAHPTQGVVEVRIQNGYELQELHNVAITSIANNDGLFYDSATSLWKNKSIASVLGYTPQAQLNGTGFVKANGTTITYDNSNYYLASNPNAYISLTALSGGAGISYNNATGVISSTITQYTDAMARAAISLTTIGSSGASTYNSITGVLNIPNYAPDLSGYLPLSGGVMTGQIVLKESSSSTDFTKGLRFPNDPFGGAGDVGGLRLYAATGENMVVELYVGNDGGSDIINFATGVGTTANNDAVKINGNKIWNEGNLTPQSAITLTTTGSSGASTFVSNTLNIPTYTLSGLGGQPLATNLTSLAGLTYASTSFVKMTSAGTFALDTNTYALSSALSSYLPLTGGTLTGNLNVGTSTNYATLSITQQNNVDALLITDGVNSNFKFQTYFNSTLGNIIYNNNYANTGYIPLTLYASKFSLATGSLVIGGTNDNGYALYTTGSAKLMGSIESTSFVKTSGTSAQILAADGSTITAGTNITISGGTISASGGGGGSMAIGGSITSATAGSILYAGVSGVLAQDNSNFYYDYTNARLGIGTTSPSFKIDVNGTGRISGQLNIESTSGSIAGARNALYLKNTALTGNQSNVVAFGSSGTASSWQILNDINADGTTINQLDILNTGVSRFTIGSMGQVTFTSSVTAASAIARGSIFQPTLIAAANSDVLSAVYINPTFTNGAFTGVKNNALIVTSGFVGIGVTSAQNALDVVRGTAGTMARGNYESASFSYNGDAKLGIYTSSSTSTDGASLLFGQTNLTSTGAVYPGFELQYVYNSGAANSMRFNSVSRNSSGVNTAAVADILTITQGSRVGVNLAQANIGSSFQVNGNAAIGYSASTSAPSNGMAISGNLGLGTTTIGSKLQVNGNAAIGYSSSTAAPTNGLAVSGNLAIGTNTASAKLTILGANTIGASIPTTWAAVSAGRFGVVSGNNSFYFDLNPAPYAELSTYNYGTAGTLPFVLQGNGGNILIGTTTDNAGKVQIAASANQASILATGYSITGANAQSLLDLTGTWNTTGNPTAIKLNLTNTASGATSNLMDLQVGGVSQFKVLKNGAIQTTAPTGGTSQPWKLGSFTSSVALISNGYIEVEINGSIYRINVTGL